MWYYLDAENRVCGPIDISVGDKRFYGWGDADRTEAFEIMYRNQDGRGHGIRPCGWERVRYTEVAEGCTVSTVFLGLDHGMGAKGMPPIVFETLANWGFDYMTPPMDESEIADSDQLLKMANAAYHKLWESLKDQLMAREWEMDRYATWEQAERGHVEMVAKMQLAIIEEREKTRRIWAAAMSSVEKEQP